MYGKEKDSRYQSAEEVITELKLIVKGLPVSAKQEMLLRPLTSSLSLSLSAQKSWAFWSDIYRDRAGGIHLVAMAVS